MLTGSGSIIGSGSGNITAPDDVVLVLGTGNRIYGNVNLYGPIINNGVIDPGIPGGGGGNTLTLYCEPKLGAGNRMVTSSQQGQANRMIIWAPVSGSGNLVMDPYGILEVHRHFWLTGQFSMYSGAQVQVDKEVVFEVSRFSPAGCPESS